MLWQKEVYPFPNKPWFLCVCSRSLLKVQWEKEKSLIMSNFSFFHSVFNSITKRKCHFKKFNLSSANAINLDQSKNLSFGKGLTRSLAKGLDCPGLPMLIRLCRCIRPPFHKAWCIYLHILSWIICHLILQCRGFGRLRCFEDIC